MIQIEAIRINVTKDIKVVDMQVSTVDELPAKNENVGGIIIAPGSIAQVIQTGAWYTLDDNGTWYDSDGAAANATNNTSSLASPTVDIDKGALLGQGKSILTVDEPEQTEPETDEPEQTELDETAAAESEVTEDER